MPLAPPHAALAAALLFAALTGCAGHNRADPSAPPRPPLSLGEESPPEPLAAAEAVSPAPRSANLRIVSGDGKDDRLRREVAPLPEDRRPPRVRAAWAESLMNASGEPVSLDDLALSESGDLVMLRSVTYADRVITTFEPPLIVLPATLSPGGESHTQRLTFTVHPMDDPSAIRDQGPATQTITLEAEQTVLAPDPIPAARVRINLALSLQAAKVSKSTRAWYARTTPTPAAIPPLGVIAEETDERVTVLGITARRTQRLVILDASPPQPR